MPYPTISIDWTRGKGYEIDDIHALKYKKTICNPRLCGEVSEGLKEHASKACVPTGYRGFKSRPLRHFRFRRGYGWQAGALSKTARRSPPKIYRRLTLKIKRKIPRPGAGLKKMAGATRIELATSGLTARRSNQLNYAPAIIKSKGKRSKLIMEPFFCF